MTNAEAEGILGAELAADVAHAVRGPYSAALPALGMLLDGALGGLTADQREAVLSVERSVRRAFIDSRDLATLLTTELGRHELRPAPCTVDELLAAALGLAALDTTVAVRIAAAPGLPAVLVDREPTAAVVAVLARRCLGLAGDAPMALELHADLEACSTVEACPTVEVCIWAAAAAAGLKPVRGATDRRAEGAALLACRAVVEAQSGRLHLSGRQGETARPRETGFRGEAEPAMATLSLPAVSA